MLLKWFFNHVVVQKLFSFLMLFDTFIWLATFFPKLLKNDTLVKHILRNAFTGFNVIYWEFESTTRLGGLNVREIGECVDISLCSLRKGYYRQNKSNLKGCEINEDQNRIFIHWADKITSWSGKLNVISSRTSLKCQAIERFFTYAKGSAEENGSYLSPRGVWDGF